MDWIEAFRADGQARWCRLRAELAQPGDAGSERLGFDENTLVTVWQWLLPRLRERTGGAADPAALPACWRRSEDYRAVYYWDDVTIERVTAVGYLLGEVVVHTHPGARWAYSPRKHDAQAGEALVHVPSPEAWINPLVIVVNALLAARDGRAGPRFLADAVQITPSERPPRLRHGVRLKLRLRGAPHGLLRQRALLPADVVARRLWEHLGHPVRLPEDGEWKHQTDVGDPPECEIDYSVRCTHGGVREVLVQVGGAPEELGSERAAVQGAMSTLIALEAETGAVLEASAEGAVAEDWRLHGRLRITDVDLVLDKIGALRAR